MSFHVPEACRTQDVPSQFRSTAADGNNGAFYVPSDEPGWTLAVIASDGNGWEHVSVHAYRGSGRRAQQRTPSWKEMAQIKRAFWDADDVVVQFYPRQADYVNLHPHTLHWWRPIGVPVPTPPPSLVGFRVGDRVRFHHEPTVRRISAVHADGMIEVDGLSGHFAAELFRDTEP
jgi:hypothetical protein